MKLSTSQLSYLKSLQIRKFRQKYRNFIAEGAKMAAEVLADEKLEIEAIFALPDWAESHESLLGKNREKLTHVSATDLNKISLLAAPNQVFMVLRQPERQLDEREIQNNLSLYLEDIQDPGNMGTLLRIADWFGIPWVFCSENCVEVFNPKVVQASMGAFLRVKSMEISFEELKLRCLDLPFCGAVLSGENIFQAKLPSAAVLVIGNESKGISADLERQLTHRFSIPKHELGGAESLNAAVAAGIICSLFRAQK